MLFQVGLILACIHILGALAMEWTTRRSVKESPTKAEDKKEKGSVRIGSTQ